MQFPFSVIVSMHTIFGIFVTLFHSNNVMLICFSLSVSALTFLIMNFTMLVQIVTSTMRLAIVFFPTIESSTEDWYEMHVGTGVSDHWTGIWNGMMEWKME